MLEPRYATLVDRLSGVIEEQRWLSDPADTLVHGTDASFYRLTPQLVLQVETLDEVAALLRQCSKLGVPVTFRAAGTSLSGQAVSDSVLALTSRAWTALEVLDGGERIRCQPAVVGRRANAMLSPYGRKIGPDPASINAAMVGGIVANNASGMCCGTAQNSYNTLSSLTIVLADGTRLDSGDPASVAAFRRDRPDLVEAVGRIAADAAGDPRLAARIRAKYAMKNTMGYSLNALVDFDDPIDIITHLMVGSEGTLGFIAEVVYDTVPDDPHKASALITFPTIAEACRAVTALAALPVSAVELMDRTSLRSVQDQPAVPGHLRDLGQDVAALLVEVRAATPEELEERAAAVRAGIAHIELEREYAFTDDATVYNGYWNIRKGLFPAVGAVREVGTTVVIEDVVFPVDRLAAATLDLQQLLARHGYGDAGIFGHALEGNHHFVFTQDFSDPAEVERYARFIDELGTLVVETHGGALKAEHGTGRNMAPFLELEWGRDAVALMRRIKDAFDPDGILNPGVIINDDPTAHLQHLKSIPPADPLIDTCTECGFCEAACLSHDLTFSPRQRIVLQREVARLRAAGSPDAADALAASREYEFAETCATDGLCGTACPVGIDTGRLVKQHRAATHDESRVAAAVADRFGAATAVARRAVAGGHVAQRVVGPRVMDAVVAGASSLVGDATHWVPNMPGAADPLDLGLQPVGSDALEVVYLSACVNRIFGPPPADGGEPGVARRTVNLLHKANCRVVIPDGIDDLCCGLAFESQGFADAGATMLDRLGDALLAASDGGRRPIVCDMSPCTLHARTGLAERGIHVHDIVDMMTDVLADRLEFEPSDEIVSLFPVCSLRKMGLVDQLAELGRRCASDVHVPDLNCCGFAGNRGMLHPELNAHALRDLDERTPDEVTAGYSTSRTCEIGLTTHGGRPYGSLVALLDDHTSPRRSRVT